MTSFEYLIGTSNDIFKTELKVYPPEGEGFCASHLSEGPPPHKGLYQKSVLSLLLSHLVTKSCGFYFLKMSQFPATPMLLPSFTPSRVLPDLPLRVSSFRSLSPAARMIYLVSLHPFRGLPYPCMKFTNFAVAYITHDIPPVSFSHWIELSLLSARPSLIFSFLCLECSPPSPIPFAALFYKWTMLLFVFLLWALPLSNTRFIFSNTDLQIVLCFFCTPM